MISARQLDTLTIAQKRLALSDDQFGRAVTTWGDVASVYDLSQPGYDRLLDYLVLRGFQDPEYVDLVAEDYRERLHEWAGRLDPSGSLHVGLHVAAGATAVHKLTGSAFQRIAFALVTMGVPNDLVQAGLKRSVLTFKQLSLVQMGRKELKVDEQLYREALRDLGGGVHSAADLDLVGFRRILVFFEEFGFVASTRRAAPAKRSTFGRRAGMATPAQIKLIRELWGEWSGEDSEEALNAWLERFHGVSSLRFVTAPIAGKALTALKAMKRRGREGNAA